MMDEQLEPFIRTGKIVVSTTIDDIFPLLCPKREETWIPGWECDVIFSRSGFNERGAIFRTKKAFGTELIWYTVEYDLKNRRIEFVNFANDICVFNFIIDLVTFDETITMTFTHKFTPLSPAGVKFIEGIKAEDFPGRLKALQGLLAAKLSAKS
jgi:hypothetical protein